MNGNLNLINGSKQIVELSVKKFYTETDFVKVRIEEIKC
jgi:Holliday junction resolvase RusA-like endonuclease